MIEIKYLRGDATNPIEVDGNKIIIHIVNSKGRWGRGFVLALSKNWKEPEIEYRKWHRNKKGFELGEVQFVKVEDDIVVCNMVAQKGIGFSNNKPPIRYSALNKCLEKVKEAVENNKDKEISIVAPKIGAGLAQGKWDKIEKLIIENLCKNDIPVYIYELK